MFLNTKTFYPVGQGGFYSERIWNGFECRTVVYDCGAVNKDPTKKLQDCIISSGIKDVDVLVISHLDEDHINGICNLESYLKQHASRLPLILIPKPTPFDMLLFYNSVSQSVIAWYLNSATQKRICFITDEKFSNEVNEPVILNESVAGKNFSHDHFFTLFGMGHGTNPWLLKFYVDKDKYEGRLTDSEKNAITDVNTIDDFKKNKDFLKKIYKKVKLRLNGSSMSMASLPLLAKGNRMESFATWLNGDASLKTELEMSAIEQHFSCLNGLNVDFQIPHHGSHHNLGRLPQNVNNLRTYIWAGFNNKYGHPSGTILNMVKNSHKQCHWITERTLMPIVLQELWP